MAADRSPLVRIAVALILLAALAAAVGAWFLLRPVARELALQEARNRGIELECRTIDVRMGRAELGDCRFSLVGVTLVKGTLRTATADLDGMHPTAIRAQDIDVRVHGDAPDLALQLTRWSHAHPRAFRTPVSAAGISVQWAAADGGAPWLVVDAGRLAPVPGGGAFVADRASVSGANVGKVGATWRADGDHETGSVALGFGTDDLSRAPVTVLLNHGAVPPTAEVTLRPTAAAKLAAPLGVALPVANVELSGRASLAFEGEGGAGPAKGTLEVVAKGWVPPHPRELDGIVFGDGTTFRSAFEVDAPRTTVKLTDSSVTAGAFRLTGGGALVRSSDSSAVTLSLRGGIPCTAIAESAAVSRLGRAAGQLLGAAARQAVKGSVSVKVEIAADTRDLSAARIDQSIGVGCGLKPFGLDLPPMPSGLPPLPSLPKDFPLPLPLPPPP